MEGCALQALADMSAQSHRPDMGIVNVLVDMLSRSGMLLAQAKAMRLFQVCVAHLCNSILEGSLQEELWLSCALSTRQLWPVRLGIVHCQHHLICSSASVESQRILSMHGLSLVSVNDRPCFGATASKTYWLKALHLHLPVLDPPALRSCLHISTHKLMLNNGLDLPFCPSQAHRNVSVRCVAGGRKAGAAADDAPGSF